MSACQTLSRSVCTWSWKRGGVFIICGFESRWELQGQGVVMKVVGMDGVRCVCVGGGGGGAGVGGGGEGERGLSLCVYRGVLLLMVVMFREDIKLFRKTK